MSSKKSPNSSPSFGRADVPEPQLVQRIKKPLKEMDQRELNKLIAALENVLKLHKGSGRHVIQNDLDKVKKYYQDRFGEEDEDGTLVSSGDSLDDAFANLGNLNLEGGLDSIFQDTDPDLPAMPGQGGGEEIKFELDASGDIFGNSMEVNPPPIPKDALDYDEIVNYGGKDKRIGELDEDVIYALEDLEKNRASIDKDDPDSYAFFRHLILNGGTLSVPEDKREEEEKKKKSKIELDMEAEQEKDEKNKKALCLNYFLKPVKITPSEDPKEDEEKGKRSLRAKIVAFQDILQEGEAESIGPFDLLKEGEKVWIVLKEGRGIELKEAHVPFWIKLIEKVTKEGSLRTEEEIHMAGGKNILPEIKKLPKSDGVLAKGGVSEVSRRITQEIETSEALVLQKEIQEKEAYEMRLKETKEAVEMGGFQIPHLQAFIDLGGKIGEEDQFGMRWVEYKGKFNFIDRNNMSVHASNFDDWLDEIGEFKLQALNTGLNLKSVTALVKHQGEFKFLESDGTLYGLDEQKILIEDTSVFDEVGLEDQYGLRWVKWNGLYNFIDSKNRILSSEKWFSEVNPFRSVVIPGLEESESKMPISLVKMDGEMHFFIPSGRLHTPSFDELEEYFKSGGVEENAWSDIEVSFPDVEPPQMVYLDSFSRRLKALSKRYQGDLKRAEAFAKLADDIGSLEGHQDARPDWGIALLIIKEKIQDSTLPGYDKRHFLFELNSVAMAANVQSEEFSPSEIDRYKWQECGTFDGGMVVNVETEEGIRYTLTDFDGKLLYPGGKFFEYIGPFTGDLAIVRKKGKYNFIKRQNGALLAEGRWFDEAHEFHAGLSRVRIGDRWNFMHSDGHLISQKGYDNAKDFNNKTGQAEVYVNGMWINIDQNGTSMMSVTARMFSLFKKNKSSGKGQSMLNLRGSEDEALVEKKALSLNKKIHQSFNGSVEAFPDCTFEIIRLFTYFREELNKASQKAKDEGSVNIIELNQSLTSYLDRTKLPGKLKSKLRYFIAKLEGGDFYGRKIESFKVSFLSVYKKALNENSEEAGLPRLIRQMEVKIGDASYSSKEEIFKILMELQGIIQGSNLKKKTKERVESLMWVIMNNDGVHFQRGESMISYKPKINNPEEIRRKEERLIGNPITRFREVCEAAEQGDWRKARTIYTSIPLNNKLEYLKLANLLNECFNRRGMELEASSKNSKGHSFKTYDFFELYEIRLFMRAVYKDASELEPRNADIYFNLGLIEEDISKFGLESSRLQKLFATQDGQKHAKRYLERAAKLNPSSSEIKREKKRFTRVIFGKRLRLAALVALGASAAALGSTVIYNNRETIAATISEFRDSLSDPNKSEDQAQDGLPKTGDEQ